MVPLSIFLLGQWYVKPAQAVGCSYRPTEGPATQAKQHDYTFTVCDVAWFHPRWHA